MVIVTVVFGFTKASAAAVPWNLGGSLTWTSDYVLRGVSQTQNLPAIQADIHVRAPDEWSAGVWASTVHVLPYINSTELDFYLSHRWIINEDLNIDITGTHYQYSNDPRPSSYVYDELSASAYWADTLYARIAWSPNTDLYQYTGYVHENEQTLTVEGGYHRPLPYGIDTQAGIGMYMPLELHNGRYGYASGGLSRRFGSFQLELNYFWVQSREHRAFNMWPAGGPWVATVIWTF